jgi:aminoglycoside phosphotransferase (APT) family kinase protein
MTPTEKHIDFKAYLAEKLNAPDLNVLKTTQVEQGMSSDTFFIEISYKKNQDAVRKEIVLKREPAGGILETYDLAGEFKLLNALKAGNIAVPPVLWHEPGAQVFERPFYVMDKVEGDIFNVDPRRPSKQMFNENERPSLAEDFVSNIVKIHNFNWRKKGLEFPDDPEKGAAPLILQIKKHEQVIARAGYRLNPIIALGINWLKLNAPNVEKPCIVHGDYRIGNFISKDGHIKAILDWELSHLGDPHEDIAYILSPAWRSAGEGLINHLMTEGDFIKKYQDMSGMRIDPYKIMYCGAINVLRGLEIMCTCAKNMAQGQSRDLRDGIHSMSVETMASALIGMIAGLRRFKEVKT